MALLRCETEHPQKGCSEFHSHHASEKESVASLLCPVTCPFPRLFLASPLLQTASPAFCHWTSDNRKVPRSSRRSTCQNTARRSCRHCAHTVPNKRDIGSRPHVCPDGVALSRCYKTVLWPLRKHTHRPSTITATVLPSRSGLPPSFTMKLV